MKPVVQEEKTGCAIASVAAIAGVSYAAARQRANALGIFADDATLWSDPDPVRRLLLAYGIKAAAEEALFTDWDTLPNCALLATKWHLERNKPHWHWVVFVRDRGQACVLDSKPSLKSNIRTDFGRMKPRWFIAIRADQALCAS